MSESSLRRMLLDLIKSGIEEQDAIIDFMQIVTAMPIGQRVEMDGGKWCEGIKHWTENDIEYFYIKGYMPKGSSYEMNLHPDAEEEMIVVEGMMENTNFKLKKGVLGRFFWRTGTPHSLYAWEDSIFYSLLTRTK